MTKNQPGIDWGWWTPVRLWIGFSILVGLLWLATPLVLKLLVTDCLAERGQLGDQYGSVNALFTGLAFAAVIATLQLQREDLRRQTQQADEEKRERGERERRDRSIALWEDYSSPIMIAQRLIAERYITKWHAREKTLLWRDEGRKPVAETMFGQQCDEMDAVHQVIKFWARAGRLSEFENLIDRDVAWDLLNVEYQHFLRLADEQLYRSMYTWSDVHRNHMMGQAAFEIGLFFTNCVPENQQSDEYKHISDLLNDPNL